MTAQDAWLAGHAAHLAVGMQSTVSGIDHHAKLIVHQINHKKGYPLCCKKEYE